MEKIKKHKELLIILFLLSAAAFLRLYRIADYMTFLGDEGRDVLVVYELLHGKLTLLGPTASVGGFFFGPIYYYLMAPFLWLFHYNPIGPAVMVALFGIATVALLYKVGSDFFGKTAGLIAAGLYTISPVVIAYSRSSWNPNLMPFFSLLIIYSVYNAVLKKSWKLFIFVGFLFGIAIQLHYVELFLAVAVGIYILLTTILGSGEDKKKKIIVLGKKYLSVCIGFLIGISPVLAFELRHEFTNTKSILSFIFASGETGGSPLFLQTIGKVFFQLFARLIGYFPPDEQLVNYDNTFIQFWQYTILLLAAVSIYIFLKEFHKYRFNKEKFSQYLLIFLWGFMGILLFGFYKKQIYVYYFEFMFPLPFLLLGNALSKVKKKALSFISLWYVFGIFLLYISVHIGFFSPLRTFFQEDFNRYFIFALPFLLLGVWVSVMDKRNKVISIASFLILFGIVMLNFQGVPFRHSANRQLNQMKTIAEFVLEKADGKPFNFALITGGNSDHAYRYFFKLANQDPVVIQNNEIDPQRTSVTDQLLVVCEKNPCEPVGHGLWEIAGFGRAEIKEKWDVSVVTVYKLQRYTGKD